MRRAIATIGRDSPLHARELAESMRNLRVELRVDSEQFVLLVRDGCVLVAPERGGELVVRTTGRKLLELTDGRATLADSVRDGGVDVRGKVERLQEGARALEWFLHGLIRSQGATGLLEELRRVVVERREG